MRFRDAPWTTRQQASHWLSCASRKNHETASTAPGEKLVAGSCDAPQCRSKDIRNQISMDQLGRTASRVPRTPRGCCLAIEDVLYPGALVLDRKLSLSPDGKVHFAQMSTHLGTNQLMHQNKNKNKPTTTRRKEAAIAHRQKHRAHHVASRAPRCEVGHVSMIRELVPLLSGEVKSSAGPV